MRKSLEWSLLALLVSAQVGLVGLQAFNAHAVWSWMESHLNRQNSLALIIGKAGRNAGLWAMKADHAALRIGNIPVTRISKVSIDSSALDILLNRVDNVTVTGETKGGEFRASFENDGNNVRLRAIRYDDRIGSIRVGELLKTMGADARSSGLEGMEKVWLQDVRVSVRGSDAGLTADTRFSVWNGNVRATLMTKAFSNGAPSDIESLEVRFDKTDLGRFLAETQGLDFLYLPVSGTCQIRGKSVDVNAQAQGGYVKADRLVKDEPILRTLFSALDVGRMNVTCGKAHYSSSDDFGWIAARGSDYDGLAFKAIMFQEGSRSTMRFLPIFDQMSDNALKSLAMIAYSLSQGTDKMYEVVSDSKTGRQTSGMTTYYSDAIPIDSVCPGY